MPPDPSHFIVSLPEIVVKETLMMPTFPTPQHVCYHPELQQLYHFSWWKVEMPVFVHKKHVAVPGRNQQLKLKVGKTGIQTNRPTLQQYDISDVFKISVSIHILQTSSRHSCSIMLLNFNMLPCGTWSKL